MDSVIEKVHEEVLVLLSEHEKKYGPSSIYFELEKTIYANLQDIAEIRDII